MRIIAFLMALVFGFVGFVSADFPVVTVDSEGQVVEDALTPANTADIVSPSNPDFRFEMTLGYDMLVPSSLLTGALRNRLTVDTPNVPVSVGFGILTPSINGVLAGNIFADYEGQISQGERKYFDYKVFGNFDGSTRGFAFMPGVQVRYESPEIKWLPTVLFSYALNVGTVAVGDPFLVSIGIEGFVDDHLRARVSVGNTIDVSFSIVDTPFLVEPSLNYRLSREGSSAALGVSVDF